MSTITRPTWADPTLDDPDRGPEVHPDDAGTWYRSVDLDVWMASDGAENGAEPIKVYVSGHRYDNGEDFPDVVLVDGGCAPGFKGGVRLRSPDARRLAQAILKACDLLDEQG